MIRFKSMYPNLLSIKKPIIKQIKVYKSYFDVNLKY